MKTINYNKLLLIAIHLLFWIISFNCWHVILNHGVESTFEIDGMEVEWSAILIINCVFILYLLMPFIWMVRPIGRRIKIGVTTFLVVSIGYVVYQLIFPKEDLDFSLFALFFIKDFMYILIFHLTIIAAVYLNLSIFISRYLTKGQFIRYLSAAVALASLAGILNYSIFNLFIDKIIPELFFISYYRIWELILIMAGYITFTTLIFLVWQYARLMIAKRDEARNELSALKAQINPHFLFNNLNTIYSLASKNDDRTKDVILQLSDFLRYILYDTSSESIPLSKEIEIIRTYIGLQKERINPQLTKVIFTEEGEFGETPIAPLLLLPLAENCFKHGIGNKQGTITISVTFDGKELSFRTENPIAPRENSLGEENGGIGLQNVEKRLNLLYPDRHTLLFQEENGIFRVELRIDLK